MCAAYNTDNFSELWTTVRENDQCCCLHSGKIIGVVANNAKKMLEFEYLHEFETICEFTLGFQSGA
jgi:hypothetical protein